MGSSVKDAHLHIGMEDSKTEKPGIWSASFAFGAVRRSTVGDEVCRCHARPAERSGLLARSPREIISTCWSHPSTASAPTSHDVHEGGWTSERLWSIRCTGRLCSHCGWQSDRAFVLTFEHLLCCAYRSLYPTPRPRVGVRTFKHLPPRRC